MRVANYNFQTIAIEIYSYVFLILLVNFSNY